jgi:DNA mismatch endonuclease (patch repair protein)
MGYRYRLHRYDLPGRPDLVFASRRKIIQMHGCYWHGHGCSRDHTAKSRQAYWGPKIEGNRKRDQRNEVALKERGWDVLTVWECELKDIQRLEGILKAFLDGEEQRSGRSTHL